MKLNWDEMATAQEIDELFQEHWWNKFSWGIVYWLVVITGVALFLCYDFYPGSYGSSDAVWWKILRHVAPFWSGVDLMNLKKAAIDVNVEHLRMFEWLFTIHGICIVVALFVYFTRNKIGLHDQVNPIIGTVSGVFVVASAVSVIVALIVIAFAMLTGGKNRDIR